MPHVFRNRQLSARSATFTICLARVSPQSSRFVSAPDSAAAAFMTWGGMRIFIGVGMSPVKISSESCHNAHRTASIRGRLPRPSPIASQKASAMMATL